MTAPDARDDVGALDARLANIQTPAGPALGLETGAGMLNLTATGAALGLDAPADLDELLQKGLASQVRAVREAAAKAPGAQVLVAGAEVRFAPLVTRPEKIVCVGFNYREHARETGTPLPKAPPLFSKFRNALNHHQGTVRLPTRIDDRFDFETELVIVMGASCRDVSEKEALDCVAGYATGNDVSARGLQTVTSQFLAGKTSDGFAPLGPFLVTRDRVPDPNNLRLQTHFNGEKRQDCSTGDMIFSCRQIIAYVSSIMTMQPGDIIFTGTPQGVIFGEKAPPEKRRWLRAGDEVVSEVEGLGRLQVRFA